MNFEEILLKTIDESFSWLGESGKRTIYFHLEKEYKINKQDIPYRIEDFTEAIENIFGLGAKLLEIKIMKSLFSKMGYLQSQVHTQESMEFIEYIESARTHGVRQFSPIGCSLQ